MPTTSFRPSIDGFAFVNSWTFDETERRKVRALSEDAASDALRLLGPSFGGALDALGLDDAVAGWVHDGLPDAYGLCGGMAFAALDYHRARRPVPRRSGRDDVPTRATPEGAALRSYLWKRMLDSLHANVATFLAWMAVLHVVPEAPFAKGGADWLRDRSREQLVVLKKHLDAGDPWPLGLVGATRDPFSNHQVLAYGYENTPGGAVIYLYDMNCPGARQTIEIALQGSVLVRPGAESCSSRARGTLRGFFCEVYKPVVPPADVVP